jgi:hypothetical protein
MADWLKDILKQYGPQWAVLAFLIWFITIGPAGKANADQTAILRAHAVETTMAVQARDQYFERQIALMSRQLDVLKATCISVARTDEARVRCSQ